jgi:hypothetical protein
MRYFLKAAYEAKFICKIEGLMRGWRLYLGAMRGYYYEVGGSWVFYPVSFYPHIPL